MFRGTYSEAFRAPSVVDLFAGLAESFPAASDPCNTARINQPQTEQALCFSQGVPSGTPPGAPQPNSQIRSLIGGNPDLKPEFGETRSLGVVYSPSWAEGLDFTLDWYKIELEDVIVGRSAQATLNGCYQTIGSTGGPPIRRRRICLCSFITRDPTNDRSRACSRPASTSLRRVEVDFAVRMRCRYSWASSAPSGTALTRSRTICSARSRVQRRSDFRLRSNLTTTAEGDWYATGDALLLRPGRSLPVGDNYFESALLQPNSARRKSTIPTAISCAATNISARGVPRHPGG